MEKAGAQVCPYTERQCKIRSNREGEQAPEVTRRLFAAGKPRKALQPKDI